MKGTGGVISTCLLKKRPGSTRNWSGGSPYPRRGGGSCVIGWSSGRSFLSKNAGFTNNGLINGKDFRLRNARGFAKNSKDGTDYPRRIKRKFVEDSARHNEFIWSFLVFIGSIFVSY